MTKGQKERVEDRDGVSRIDCDASLSVNPSGAKLTTLWQGGRPIGQVRLGVPPRLLKAGPSLSASIVICTRDRPQELARCLASMPDQSRRPDEIVVVDNASITDETEQVCLKAGVRYVRESRPGLDIARNTGARACSSEIIAYTDDDVILDPYWLERLAEAFDEPDILGVTGLVLAAELSTPAQWHFETHWGFGKGFERVDFGSEFFAQDKWRGCPAWEVGAGASMAFRKSAFETVGYFDERLDVGAAGCSGDSEFWHRILSKGGRCRYDPTSVAYHFHRRDYEGLRKQIRAYMRGHSAALLVQFERSGNWGNLRRVLLTMPIFYVSRLVKRAFRKPREQDLFLREEIAGFVAGVMFYLRTPRATAGDPR